MAEARGEMRQDAQRRPARWGREQERKGRRGAQGDTGARALS